MSTNSRKFVGEYVHDVVELFSMSAVTGMHAVWIGPPGWGKTDILTALSDKVAQRWSFTRFDPSTPMEKIEGMPIPEKLLASPPVYELEREGTPYQIGNNIMVLDEVFRPGDEVFDKLLDTLDRRDIPKPEQPVAFATANFVAKGERVEALIDRFPIWYHQTETFIDDIGAMVKTQLMSGGSPSLPDGLPTWDEIETVRAYQPDDDTARVVSAYVSELAQVADQEGRAINPRRIAQWTRIVYRHSAWLHGKENFDSVHPTTKRLMKFAYPNVSAEEQGVWHDIVTSIIDKFQAALDSILKDAMREFLKVSDMPKHERDLKLGDLGQTMASFQASLRSLKEMPGVTDEQMGAAGTAIHTLTEWFSNAVSGESNQIRMKESR